MMPAVFEGYLPYLGHRTYYRVVGDLEESLASGRVPLVTLHGGPGSTHNYMELLDCVADDGRAIVSYDQIGCGKSYLEGHPELWDVETWLGELEALVAWLNLRRFHLLGQSWGGMLALTYLTRHVATVGADRGACSVVLSSTLPSSQLWGREQHRMARQLPADEWAALREAEGTGDFSGAAYQRAIDHYMGLHCADLSYGPDAPECLRRPKRSGAESYAVAWGPNELMPTGTLSQWDVTDRLPDIQTPTLIISGTDDLCTPLIAKTMFDALPNARWELLEGCRHMCYADDHERYVSLLRAWLDERDELDGNRS